MLKLFEHLKSNGISIKVFKFRLEFELNLNLMYFLFLKYSKTGWCQNIDQSTLTMYISKTKNKNKKQKNLRSAKNKINQI